MHILCPHCHSTIEIVKISTHEEIACRAHDLWENEGRPEGRELEHWLQAESQIQQGRRQATVSV